MRTRVRRALCFDSFEAWRDSLLRSGGWEGPKEPDPDTPPLLRVLPSTPGTRQFPFWSKHLQRAGTGQYPVLPDMRCPVFNELRGAGGRVPRKVPGFMRRVEVPEFPSSEQQLGGRRRRFCQQRLGWV